MKEETHPVTEDKWLLRRVHRDCFRWEEPLLVQAKAFAPRVKGRDIDDEGISLYRAACLADPSDILAGMPPEKAALQGIVRVQATFLISLGLSMRPNPVDPTKGHIVIPELSAETYRTAKEPLVPLLARLAIEASLPGNIIRRPEPPEDVQL